jgi:cytochrome c
MYDTSLLYKGLIMLLKLFLFTLILLLSACNENKPTKKYNAKALLQEKCSTCHNLEMPPLTSPDEKAPPIMAVSFHVHDFVKPSDESQRTAKAIEFVVDYVRAPSLEKSFCDKESLQRYGVMPSQKDNVTEDELRAIASYMFAYYNQNNFLQQMQSKAKLDALPAGERIALEYKCFTCHRKEKDLVGPSFSSIRTKYLHSADGMQKSIQSGSKGKWEGFSATMPPFQQISQEELQTISAWILGI